MNDSVLTALADEAWKVRKNAHLFGATAVGCAVLCDDDRTFLGCNVEHRFRCHDVHAEVNAITTMVANGGSKLKAIVVVAERENFTPCGGCLDWILQFATDDCIVAFQRRPGASLTSWAPKELMPHYPK